MQELFLERNEEKESVRRSIKIVRKMIHKLLVYVFGNYKQLIVEKKFLWMYNSYTTSSSKKILRGDGYEKGKRIFIISNAAFYYVVYASAGNDSGRAG